MTSSIALAGSCSLEFIQSKAAEYVHSGLSRSILRVGAAAALIYAGKRLFDALQSPVNESPQLPTGALAKAVLITPETPRDPSPSSDQQESIEALAETVLNTPEPLREQSPDRNQQEGIVDPEYPPLPGPDSVFTAIEESNRKLPPDAPAAIIIRCPPEDDDQLSFSYDHLVYRDMIQQLIKSGHYIAIQFTTRGDHVQPILKEQSALLNRPITKVILEGHGNEDCLGIQFSPKKKKYKITDNHRDTFASCSPNVEIIVMACYSANLAQKISEETGKYASGFINAIDTSDIIPILNPDHFILWGFDEECERRWVTNEYINGEQLPQRSLTDVARRIIEDAEKGRLAAMMFLSQHTDDLPVGSKTRMDWLKRAVESDELDPLFEYGSDLVLYGHNDEERKKGLEIAKKAANRGYSAAQYWLGGSSLEMRLPGEHPKEQIRAAIHWYQKLVINPHASKEDVRESSTAIQQIFLKQALILNIKAAARKVE